MAAVATESWGRRLSERDAIRLYTVTGASDEADAKSAVETAAPSTLDSGRLALEDVQVEEIGGDTGQFEAVAVYRRPDEAQPEDGDDPKYRFSTQGSTLRRTTFLANPTRYAPAGETAPDHKWAINVRPDGGVDGVEVNEPGFAWTETHYFAEADITEAYLDDLFDLSWHTNDATFKVRKGATATYAIGEVLFEYAEGGPMANGDWEITFHFVARPNVTNQTIGDITGVAKEGQQYAWVEFATDEDSTAHRIVSKPIAVHVGDVYPSGTFSDLGIR